MHVHRRTALAVVATVALTLPAAPASAATVSDPILGDQITPLGLAVHGEDIYVANAFAGFLTRNGEPIAFIDGPAGGALPGVAVNGSGTVAYTGSVFPEFDPNPGDPPQTYLYLVGQQAPLADLGTYEATMNPDSGQQYGLLDASASCRAKLARKIGPEALPYYGVIDSNPYAVASDGADGWYVADAAANAILHVDAGGSISTIALLPPVPQVLTKELRKSWRQPNKIDGERNPDRVKLPRCAVGKAYYGEPVPTDVELHGGMLYVSLLPGFPEMGGMVVVVDPGTGDVVSTLATGLEGAVDLAVDGDTVYVAELFGNRLSKWSGGSMVDAAFVLMPGAVEVSGGTILATSGVFVETPPFGGVVEVTF